MRFKYVLAACFCTLSIVKLINFTPTAASSYISVSDIDCYVSQIFLPNVHANIPTITPTPLPWEEEPNDIAAEATGPIDSGVNYYGYPDDLRDYFSFNVAISGRISITLQNLTGSGNRQLLLYHESTNNVVAYVTEEPFEIVRNNRVPGRYFIQVYVESDHNSTTPYTLRVNYPVALAETASLDSISDSLPECTPTHTPVPPTDTSTPTTTPTSVNNPTPTPTATTTVEGQSPYADWLICWHGTDGHEVLVAYPINQARSGIELTMPLVRPWSGATADLANDSLKMCLAEGVWYGAADTSADPPWFPQVSYVRYEEDQVRICWDIPGCSGHQETMKDTGAPPARIVNLLRPPVGTGIQTLGYTQSDPLDTPSPPTSTNTPTLTPTPTNTPTLTPKPTSQHGYNFESDTENWTTSEGEFKPIILTTTTQIVYSGVRAFQLEPNLRSDSSEVYRHTETVAYFNNTIPEGFVIPGPYNLAGKSVSCFVYLPSELAPSGNPQAYIQLFVKDKDFRNHFNTALDIVPANVNKWLQLNLTVGQGDGMDNGFDSQQSNALGISIKLHNQATLNYAGPLYIDHCTIPQP